MTRLVSAAVAALAVLLAGGSARAQEVTLTVHHFLSPQSVTHRNLIEPWAERVERQSDGRIEVRIFPSMALGGTPPQLYRQVRDGAADIVWTLIGYTPGVFPRTEVFELPNVHEGDARATNLAIQDTFELLAPDFEDTKPLLIHVHAGNALHLRETAVAAPEDVKDLKIRTPSRTAAWMTQAWGAEPVGMPVPDLPQALSKGTVEGALVPFEILEPLKLHQLTDVSVEGAGGDRFGTSVFMFAMNKDRYDSLAPELQRVIDANSGRALAKEMGAVWNRVERRGKELQRSSGGRVIELTPEQTAAFETLSRSVTQRWIDQAEARGIAAETLVERAKAAVERHSD